MLCLQPGDEPPPAIPSNSGPTHHTASWPPPLHSLGYSSRWEEGLPLPNPCSCPLVLLQLPERLPQPPLLTLLDNTVDHHSHHLISTPLDWTTVARPPWFPTDYSTQSPTLPLPWTDPGSLPCHTTDWVHTRFQEEGHLPGAYCCHNATTPRCYTLPYDPTSHTCSALLQLCPLQVAHLFCHYPSTTPHTFPHHLLYHLHHLHHTYHLGHTWYTGPLPARSGFCTSTLSQWR